MKKTILQSTCDRCGTEEITGFDKAPVGGDRDRYVLPEGWVNVSGNTARKTLFEFDLCPDCARMVRELAGASPVAV